MKLRVCGLTHGSPAGRPLMGTRSHLQSRKRSVLGFSGMTPLLEEHPIRLEADAPVPWATPITRQARQEVTWLLGNPAQQVPGLEYTPAGLGRPQAAVLTGEAAAGAQGRWRSCGACCLLSWGHRPGEKWQR